jgi:1-acyl-sn-glycerol-3-phosphate acyltransferase
MAVVIKTMGMNLGIPYRASEAMLWPWMMAVTRRDWRGAENLRVHGEGIVVAPNHISWFDPLVIAHFLNDNRRPPRFMGKQEVFDVPVVGSLIRGAGQIPVLRGSDPAAALQEAIVAVRAGECVVMYPEGTITRDPGLWPMTGKTGALRVALASGAPLIPVAQWGANKVSAPYSKVVRLVPPKLMQVVAGAPLAIDDLRGQEMTRELLEEGTARLMAAITALLETLRGEKAPEVRYDLAAHRRQHEQPGPDAAGDTAGDDEQGDE